MIKLKGMAGMAIGMAIMGTSVFASSDMPKRTLKGNMKEVYRILPPKVDTLSDMFTQGLLYGRLRFNGFGFEWKKELESNGKTLKKDHAIAGIGGSLIYKTAYLNGFGMTAGLYLTGAAGTLDRNEAYLYKAGKDTFDRHDYLNGGAQGFATFAQAYLEYRNAYVDFKAGRQIFESFLTASNDTKMIPNTFEGVAFKTEALPGTQLKVAYLTKQKLRDHAAFHHVLAYGDNLHDGTFHMFTQNDDSAMHRGLTESSLAARGIDDRLVVFEATNKSMDNLTLRVNYTAVPELVASAMIQADYAMKIGDLSVTPAIRYMQQFDNGAGEIGGANLKTVTAGYRNPNSLDSRLFAAKIDLQEHAWKVRLGYTQVADRGDIVAPWRGFPTGGFTRAMGQYNWYANTRTALLRTDYDFGKAGLVPRLKAFMRFAIQDFDDDKPGVQADSDVVTLDLLKGFERVPNLSVKFRYAHVFGDPLVKGTIKKSDPSYDEARFEINYLF